MNVTITFESDEKIDPREFLAQVAKACAAFDLLPVGSAVALRDTGDAYLIETIPSVNPFRR